jgi:glycosyltransferase involved in cell wall biosynthesis
MQSTNHDAAPNGSLGNQPAGFSEDIACPRISFAIPVRNGERFLGRAIESALAQDFDDFEIVVCDNASTDGTGELVRRYCERDRRVRYILNEENIGQIENFNRVYEQSRGEFIRWMGADDQLESDYARKCVAALDARPDAVGVTTQWRYMDDMGVVDFLDVPGPRVDASSAEARLRLTLRMLQSQELLFDPIYSLIRRNALERTGLLPINRWTDRLLAVELCLLGSFCHLDDCLSTRRNSREPRKVRLARWHTSYAKGHREHRWMLYAAYAGYVRRGSLGGMQKLSCWTTILAYWLRDEFKRKMRRMKRRAKKAA